MINSRARLNPDRSSDISYLAGLLARQVFAHDGGPHDMADRATEAQAAREGVNLHWFAGASRDRGRRA